MATETFTCNPDLVTVAPELCAYRMACIIAILRGLPLIPESFGGPMPTECINNNFKTSHDPCEAVLTVPDNTTEVKQ